jgi:hypothetical protein
MSRFVLTAELSLQAPRNVAQVVQQIQSQLNGVQVNVQVQGARQAQRDVDQLTRSADRANDSFFKMGRTFTASIRRFSALAIATRAVSLLTNTLSGAIEEAISFQQEVVRLSQVTGDSIGRLSKLTNEITNLATTLGVSSDKLLSVTTILAQAGLSADDTRIALSALAKTELAPTFGNITETAEGAVAILAQFKLGAGALEAQLGSLNAVSGKFAVESGDLVETIRRTGGVFKAAGGDLNELIALFTSVRATTRESAATIATGLRTIFTRIQRPATIAYLKQFGVELTDLEGKFVGPYEAIKQLSAALSGLEEGDISFVQIAEELGGFRQIGKVIPLLREFATAQQALKVAQEGSGSLTQDQATAQLALAVQITKVKEEFFALVRGFTETSTFRVMADVVLKLASTFIRLADSLQPILPILTAFAGIRLAQGIGGLIGGVLGKARGMSKGGKVLAFAKGGLVPGSGSGTADDVPAMLSSGEFVMKQSAVQRIGANNLSHMNMGGSVQRFAAGGKSEPTTVQPELIQRGGFKYNKADVLKHFSLEEFMAQIPVPGGYGEQWKVGGFGEGSIPMPPTLKPYTAPPSAVQDKFSGAQIDRENRIANALMKDGRTVRDYEGRTSDTKAWRKNRGYNLGGEIQKFALGGEASVGAAVLKGRKTTQQSTISYNDIVGSVRQPEIRDRVAQTIPVGKSYNLIKDPLNKEDFQYFDEAINKGLVSSVNSASKALSKVLNVPSPAVPKSQVDNFSRGLNDAARGNLFETILTSMLNQGEWEANPDPQRPFDFMGGVGLKSSSGGLLFPSISSLNYVDAKASMEAASKENMAKKIANQLFRESKGVEFSRKQKLTKEQTVSTLSEKYKNFPDRLAQLNAKERELVQTTINSGKIPSRSGAIGTIRGLIQRFAVGGRAKGIEGAPLVDDILQASGSILPRPSAAIQALINAGGGAVDVDRTLLRTIGDKAYGKAPTSGAQDAALNTYFRDEKNRLQDLKTAPITQFGKELQAAIKSGQLDARKISIASKSQNVRGAREYLSQLFGIPTQNIAFTQGGDKGPFLDAIRKKGPRVDRVARFATGGVVPGVGNGDTVPAMLNEGDFVIRKSSTKNIGTDVLSSMAGYASGGSVSKGVPALLTPGEFVFSKKEAQGIGYGKLNRMNKVGKYAKGGYVGFRKFFKGGVAEKDTQRAQGEIIVDVSQAESIFNNLISQLPAGIGEAILNSFKGIQALQPGETQTVVNTKNKLDSFKETTRGQAIGTRSKSGTLLESGIGLQLQGKKVAATEETVAHETGHIADMALGKKGMASEEQGTFQFELVEKVKPQMEAAFKAAGVDADRIKEYLGSNKELFAEFFAKASPEVRAIITSTTDAAAGMRMLADHLGDVGHTYAGLEASDLNIPTSLPATSPSPSASPGASPTVVPIVPDTTNTYIKNMSQAIKERTQTLIQSKAEESRLNSEVTKQANLITQLRAQSSAGQKVSGELHQAHVRQAELLKQQEAAIEASLTAEQRLTAAQKRKEELILQAKAEKQAAAESRKATLKGGTPTTFAESTVGKIEAEQDRNRKTKTEDGGSGPAKQVTDRSAQLATALAAAGTALGYFQSEITENSSTMAIFTNNALSSIQSITLVVAALQAFGVSLGRAAIAANLDSLFKAVPALGKQFESFGISTTDFASGLQSATIAATAVVAGFNILMSTLQESARLEKERQMKLAVSSDIGSEQQKQAMDKAGVSAGSEASSGVRNTFGTVGGIIGGIIGGVSGALTGGAAGAAGGTVALPVVGTVGGAGVGATVGGAVGGAKGAAIGTGLGVLAAGLLGYTEEASVLAESQNRIATAKLIADKEMAESSKDASKALKDFQDGTATAADVLKSTQGAGQAVSMQIAETKKANEAEKGLANKPSIFGYIGSKVGLSDSKETKQKKADENSKIRDAELKKAVDGYIEMNQAGTSALARANAATGQSFDEFFSNLRTSNAPLAEAYASSEENLKDLEKQFANISKEADKTRKAFEAINLGFQGVNATASALTVGLENYLASQEAGNVGLAQSINTLQAGLTNAAQGISTEAFQSALTDAEAALTNMGASGTEIDKFKGNMDAINTAQKFYASATQDAKENLQAEFKRGASGQSDPQKRQEALSNAITSQLEGAGIAPAVRKRIGDALAGAKIADGDLEAILDGNFEVLDKVLKDLGEKTFGQVSKSLEQYVKYQQQLVKLTQERIKIEGQLRDAQKSTIDATLEAAKIAQEFGGAAVTPDQNRKAIIEKANVDSQGLGIKELKTGSAEEIKARQASIRQAISEQKTIVTQAAAGDKGSQKALQGEGGAERAANTERLQKLAQENYNTTKALIDQKREEIKLIQSKNQLEKASMDALIDGDIMKFFDSQAAMGAQAALATGDQQLISQFDTASLGAATKDLERQKEAGVTQRFGRDIGGSGGLIEGGYSAIGGRVGLSQNSIQAAAQTTPEQLQAEKEARELAGTLPENMSILEMSAQTDLDAANKQLEAAEKQLEAARGEVNKSAAGPVKPAGALARGGTVYASRGTFVNFQPRGTDTVPAMLTPGEFVVNRQSVQRGNNLAILTAMNKGQSVPAATGMARGGPVKYMDEGGVATKSTNSGVSISIDVKALQAFSASLSQFNDALATNIQTLKDTKFQVSLSPTNINVNLTGTSFLEMLTSSLKTELLSYVGKVISQYTIGTDGKLKKSGSNLGTGL